MEEDFILRDSHGRCVRYLRVSVTDRCNLRCSYCAVDSNFTFMPHDRILSYEEILTLTDSAVQAGIDKIRFTGGEPFIRKDFIPFLHEVRRKHPNITLCITTNATLIEDIIPELEQAKINTLNISFDTFDASRFMTITGKDLYNQAFQGLMAAVNSSLTVKVNCVIVKGINDDELATFILFAKDNGIDVRFIEFMPLGGRSGWSEDAVWTGEEILREASTLVSIKKVERSPRVNTYPDNGPATMYSIENSAGRIGIISPLSNHFCGSCNRIRVTADGHLRTCLFSDNESPLRQLLRNDKTSSEEIIRYLQECLKDKPIGADICAQKRITCKIIERGMSSIGG